MLRIPAALYGMGVGVRNFAFDQGIIKSKKYSIPTICVGNLSVGGSGKTPHIELLISLLRQDYKIAVLTRGYGRKKRKPVIATEEDDAHTIGDEPFQIKRKFPNVMVYVDGNRRRALRNMEQMPPEERPDVVLMDDGFQHRYVKPSFSIILTPYKRPYNDDHFMPFGYLRDSKKEAVRADTIIVTGTPKGVNITEKRLKEKNLGTYAYQDVIFTSVVYHFPKCLFTEHERTENHRIKQKSPLLLLSGIADPAAFFATCERAFPNVVDTLEYPDHHNYTKAEIDALVQSLTDQEELFLLTTEKDGMRLLTLAKWIPMEVRSRIWILPIGIEMKLADRITLLRKAKRAIKNNGLTM